MQFQDLNTSFSLLSLPLSALSSSRSLCLLQILFTYLLQFLRVHLANPTHIINLQVWITILYSYPEHPPRCQFCKPLAIPYPIAIYLFYILYLSTIIINFPPSFWTVHWWTRWSCSGETVFWEKGPKFCECPPNSQSGFLPNLTPSNVEKWKNLFPLRWLRGCCDLMMG